MLFAVYCLKTVQHIASDQFGAPVSLLAPLHTHEQAQVSQGGAVGVPGLDALPVVLFGAELVIHSIGISGFTLLLH